MPPPRSPALALALLALLAAAPPARAQGTSSGPPYAYCDDSARRHMLALANLPVSNDACLPAVPVAERQFVSLSSGSSLASWDKDLQPTLAAGCADAAAINKGECEPVKVYVTLSTNKFEPLDAVEGTASRARAQARAQANAIDERERPLRARASVRCARARAPDARECERAMRTQRSP